METERLIIDSVRETDKEDYFINISHDKRVLVHVSFFRGGQTPAERRQNWELPSPEKCRTRGSEPRPFPRWYNTDLIILN